jgi:hypothetical protein
MYLSQFDSIRFFYSCEHPLNFVFVCQSMSSLALELKARGITLVDPLEAAALKAKKAGVTFDDCKEDFDFDIAEQEEVAKSTPKKKSNAIKTTSLVAFCNNNNTKKESSLQKPISQKPTSSFQPSNTKDVFEKGVQC